MDNTISSSDTTCSHCGYDLRAHQGETRRCPECGMNNQFPRRTQYSPLRKRWRIIAIVLTTTGFILMAGFRLILAFNGLRVTDLWNAGNSLTSPTNPIAVSFAKTGLPLATVSVYLAVFTSAYCIALTVVALIKRDKKTSTGSALCWCFQ